MSIQRAVFLAVITGSVLFSNLLQVGYSAGSMELWILSLGFAALGFVIGLLIGRTILYGPVYALILYVFLDSNVYDGGWIMAVLLLAVVLAMAVGMQRIGSWALPVVTAFVGVFSLTSVLQAGGPLVAQSGAEHPKPTVAGEQRPPVIHLILDEYMSPDALPDTIPPNHPATSIMGDMASRGFRVYEHARATSVNTYQSVSGVFDLSTETNNYVKQPSSGKWAYVLKENRLVDTLQAQGYGVSVIQSNYLELCPDDAAVRCATYSRANKMEVFDHMGLSIGKRLQLALLSVHEAYINKGRMKVHLYEEGLKLLLGENTSFDYFSRPLVMLDILDAMERGEYIPAQGEALVAHLLLPHFPYVLDAECRFKDVSGWAYPSRHSDAAELPHIYAGYWDQVACLHSRLLKIIDGQKLAEGTVIILQGDHGSRISKETASESDADLLTAFLAIRGPKAPPGPVPDPVNLQEEIARFYRDQM